MPLIIVPVRDATARLLVERSFLGDHPGVRLTCVAAASDRCQGVFLQSHELRPLILALLEEIAYPDDAARICETAFAIHASIVLKQAWHDVETDVYGGWGPIIRRPSPTV